MEFTLEKVGPRDVDRGKRECSSVHQPDARRRGSQGPAVHGTTVSSRQSPSDSMAVTVQELPVPSKGVSNMEHGKRGERCLGMVII